MPSFAAKALPSVTPTPRGWPSSPLTAKKELGAGAMAIPTRSLPVGASSLMTAGLSASARLAATVRSRASRPARLSLMRILRGPMGSSLLLLDFADLPPDLREDFRVLVPPRFELVGVLIGDRYLRFGHRGFELRILDGLGDGGADDLQHVGGHALGREQAGPEVILDVVARFLHRRHIGKVGQA